MSSFEIDDGFTEGSDIRGLLDRKALLEALA